MYADLTQPLDMERLWRLVKLGIAYEIMSARFHRDISHASVTLYYQDSGIPRKYRAPTLNLLRQIVRVYGGHSMDNLLDF